MREVKYNAWDVHKKKMIFWEQITCPSNIEERGYQYDFLNGVIGNLIPLQYTDHKDISNREIYEGNIVENRFGCGIVTWMGMGFWLEVNPNYKQTYTKINSTTLEFGLRDDKVIGDIRMNPRLLEEKKNV